MNEMPVMPESGCNGGTSVNCCAGAASAAAMSNSGGCSSAGGIEPDERFGIETGAGPSDQRRVRGVVKGLMVSEPWAMLLRRRPLHLKCVLSPQSTLIRRLHRWARSASQYHLRLMRAVSRCLVASFDKSRRER